MTTSTQTPIVEVRNVGKSYGPVNALSGVLSTVTAGHVTCALRVKPMH